MEVMSMFVSWSLVVGLYDTDPTASTMIGAGAGAVNVDAVVGARCCSFADGCVQFTLLRL